MNVIEEIAAERKRQIEVEGWTPEHDDLHTCGELARAAACYALFSSKWINEDLIAHFWLWDAEHWKPTTARRNMIKALALGIAEVERLDRASVGHHSDCAIHNAPAMEAGPCDCPEGANP